MTPTATPPIINDRYAPEKSGPEILTIREAAQLLRCSKAHVANVLNGRVSGIPPIPHVVVGRRKLIRRAALEHWLENVEAR
jgi:excisionase family DNA binding protein